MAKRTVMFEIDCGDEKCSYDYIYDCSASTELYDGSACPFGSYHVERDEACLAAESRATALITAARDVLKWVDEQMPKVNDLVGTVSAGRPHFQLPDDFEPYGDLFEKLRRALD